MIEVLNEFTHPSDGLTDLGTVSVIVPVDTVCTVVFDVIVGIALELLGEEQRVDTDAQAGPDQNQEDSRNHSPLFESHLLLLGIHPSRFVDRLDERLGHLVPALSALGPTWRHHQMTLTCGLDDSHL